MINKLTDNQNENLDNSPKISKSALMPIVLSAVLSFQSQVANAIWNDNFYEQQEKEVATNSLTIEELEKEKLKLEIKILKEELNQLENKDNLSENPIDFYFNEAKTKVKRFGSSRKKYVLKSWNYKEIEDHNYVAMLTLKRDSSSSHRPDIQVQLNFKYIKWNLIFFDDNNHNNILDKWDTWSVQYIWKYKKHKKIHSKNIPTIKLEKKQITSNSIKDLELDLRFY